MFIFVKLCKINDIQRQIPRRQLQKTTQKRDFVINSTVSSSPNEKKTMAGFIGEKSGLEAILFT